MHLLVTTDNIPNVARHGIDMTSLERDQNVKIVTCQSNEVVATSRDNNAQASEA